MHITVWVNVAAHAGQPSHAARHNNATVLAIVKSERNGAKATDDGLVVLESDVPMNQDGGGADA